VDGWLAALLPGGSDLLLVPAAGDIRFEGEIRSLEGGPLLAGDRGCVVPHARQLYRETLIAIRLTWHSSGDSNQPASRAGMRRRNTRAAFARALLSDLTCRRT